MAADRGWPGAGGTSFLPPSSFLRVRLLPASATSAPQRPAAWRPRRRSADGAAAVSGEQALAAQAAGAALVGRAQLAHLVLPDLAHQCVEGVLHPLGRERGLRAAPPRRRPAPGPHSGSRGPRATGQEASSSAAPPQPTKGSGPTGTPGPQGHCSGLTQDPPRWELRTLSAQWWLEMPLLLS